MLFPAATNRDRDVLSPLCLSLSSVPVSLFLSLWPLLRLSCSSSTVAALHHQKQQQQDVPSLGWGFRGPPSVAEAPGRTTQQNSKTTRRKKRGPHRGPPRGHSLLRCPIRKKQGASSDAAAGDSGGPKVYASCCRGGPHKKETAAVVVRRSQRRKQRETASKRQIKGEKGTGCLPTHGTQRNRGTEMISPSVPPQTLNPKP